MVLVIAMPNLIKSPKMWCNNRYLQALQCNITCLFLRVIIVEIQMVYNSTMNFMQKKTVWMSLNQCHGPQRTGPRLSGPVPSISGSVLDWLQSMVAHFGGKKLD